MHMPPSFALFSSDLDGTLLGDPAATLAFKKNWEALRRNGSGSDKNSSPYLVYNSGRLLDHSLEAVETTDLPDPDYLICGVGTVIYDFAAKTVLNEFSDSLNKGWDLDVVLKVMRTFPHAEMQAEKFQNRFKSSWYLHNATPQQLEEILASLHGQNLEVNLIYSSDRDLDILPAKANKGNALAWLAAWLKISPEACLVAGDTGNDSSMFALDGVRGIAVGNALPELMSAATSRGAFVAEKPFAAGVLEGLSYYGVLSGLPDRRAYRDL